MTYSLFILAGILAPIVYAATVILGKVLRRGYSHISNFVSELIISGAPNKRLLDPLFALYNLLTAAFAWGILAWVGANSLSAGALASGTWAGIVLLAEAVFGFVTVFFPQDPRGRSMTITGKMHILLAGLSSLATMAAMALLALCLGLQPGLGSLSLYSWISLAIVFLSGGMTAAMTAKNSPLLGLLERITIGGFLQWMLVIAIWLFQLA
jgi:hypothetical protein